MRKLTRAGLLALAVIGVSTGVATAQTGTVAPDPVPQPGQVIVTPPVGTTGERSWGPGVDQFGDNQQPSVLPPARPSGVPAENLGARAGSPPSQVVNPGPKGVITGN